MSICKFETMDGVTFDKIIEKMKQMIDHEKFVVYDFDHANYHWTIGGAVAAVMRGTIKQDPISILGIDVEVIDWNSKNWTSIFLNINQSEKDNNRDYFKIKKLNDQAKKICENFAKGYVRENTKLVPKNVIFNNPATIVFWYDGTKTVVKAEGEPFDPEKGLAMAYAKRASGNTGSYYNEFKKWLPKEEEDKKCVNCKYLRVPAVIEPCRTCDSARHSKWEKRR